MPLILPLDYFSPNSAVYLSAHIKKQIEKRKCVVFFAAVFAHGQYRFKIHNFVPIVFVLFELE